jgi:hypothetical protein
MIIRSNLICAHHIHEAFYFARVNDGMDIYYDDFSQFTPRKFTMGYKLYGYAHEGKYASAHDSLYKAATWEAWGYVIARLYAIDPNAQISFYNSAAHFYDWCKTSRNYETSGHFLNLMITAL